MRAAISAGIRHSPPPVFSPRKTERASAGGAGPIGAAASSLANGILRHPLGAIYVKLEIDIAQGTNNLPPFLIRHPKDAEQLVIPLDPRILNSPVRGQILLGPQNQERRPQVVHHGD